MTGRHGVAAPCPVLKVVRAGIAPVTGRHRRPAVGSVTEPSSSGNIANFCPVPVCTGSLNLHRQSFVINCFFKFIDI